MKLIDCANKMNSNEMNEDETKKSGRSEENPKQNKCNRFSLLRAR